MGDFTVSFVCRDPWKVPAPANVDAAMEIVRQATKSHDGIEVLHTDKVNFHVDYGDAFETWCPRCGRLLPMKDVLDWLDEDGDKETGFRLVPRAMPCCETVLNLNELIYELPAAFAKFAIEIRRPEWVFNDKVPSAREARALSEAYRRTGVMGEEWREVSRAERAEIRTCVEQLGERVGEALGTPVRVVWCNF